MTHPTGGPPPPEAPADLWAWVGSDADGHPSLVVLLVAQLKVRAQALEPLAQARADELGEPVHLVRYRAVEVGGTVKPRRRPS